MSTAESESWTETNAVSIPKPGGANIGLEQLRCDVIQEPAYLACGRCQRLNLDCKIESNFKRVGKRSKNAEMEREIVELRRQLAVQQTSPMTGPSSIKASMSVSGSPTLSHLPPTLDQYMGSQEAVASLMDLRSGLDGGSFLRSPNGQILPSRRIEDVVLIYDRIRDLFQQFVTQSLCRGGGVN